MSETLPPGFQEVSCDGLTLPDPPHPGRALGYLSASGTGTFTATSNGVHVVCNQGAPPVPPPPVVEPEVAVLAQVLEEPEVEVLAHVLAITGAGIGLMVLIGLAFTSAGARLAFWRRRR